MSRRSHDDVQDSELDCLTMWPEGTVGFNRERDLVRVLNELCKQFGYGRVPQLAAQIEDLWRNPEKREDLAQARKDHLDFVEECRTASKETKP